MRNSTVMGTVHNGATITSSTADKAPADRELHGGSIMPGQRPSVLPRLSLYHYNSIFVEKVVTRESSP